MNRDRMPEPAPLDMPVQAFDRGPCAVVASPGALLWRFAVFLPAILVTGLLLWGLHGLFMKGGFSALEYLLMGLIGLTFIWITLAVSTVGIGIAARRQKTLPHRAGAPLDVALLVPVYNEVPADVFGNAAAMLDELAARGTPHRYSLFVLSDTTNAEVAAQEEAAFASLRGTAPLPVFYRRRSRNTDRKVGNLADWITGWGADYDAMLVLDADSLMSGRAINRLSDALSADPDAGLIQSHPQLIEADTLFARAQQFSGRTYGWLLAEGLATWSQSESNYWGHNAIIRTRAFAEAAGLPKLKGDRLILSHDFVEAGLLRRAGWRVRFLPRLTGSFEETPATLVDHVMRDQRWCRGNLQHLRLLFVRGLHPVTRFHLFQGAMAYLMSPAWFVLLVFWTLLGRDAETNVISYFNEANPMFPNWPPEMTHMDSVAFLLIMYGMLLAPKLAGAALLALRPRTVRHFGGYPAFGAALLTEIAVSVAYAPILMVQQTLAVLGGLLTRGTGWRPQARDARSFGLGTLLRFHAVETVLGLLLVAGLAGGFVSWWLSPIILSLLAAVPLSAASGMSVTRYLPRALRMNSPLTLNEPAIVRSARMKRAQFDFGVATDP